MERADHADAYEQPPLSPEDEHVAVVTLRCPSGGEQLFGATAAALHYSCFTRIIASFRLQGVGDSVRRVIW